MSKTVVKKKKGATEPVTEKGSSTQTKAPGQKADPVVEIDKLLKQLSIEDNKMEKRRIRRNLRNLGHRGGLKTSKYAKAEEAKAPAKTTVKA